MSTGLFLPSAITLDIAKDIAKAFSGLALTFGSCAGITFNTCKYFAKADKTERAMLLAWLAKNPPTFGQHFPEIRWDSIWDSARSQGTVLLSVVWWSYLTWWL